MVPSHTCLLSQFPLFLVALLAAALVSGHHQGSDDQSGHGHGSSSGQHQSGSGGPDRGGAARGLNHNQGGAGGGGGAARGSNQNYGGESEDPSARYVGRIYTDPEYYGYEATYPGGKANFKAYRSEHGSERSGQDQHGGRNSQEQSKKSPGGGYGQQQRY